MLGEIIGMSVANIVHSKTRSLLTILGIVIGVASIIALMFIGEGAAGNISSQLSGLGGNKLTVQISGTPIKRTLFEPDLQAIAEQPDVVAVSPSTSSRAAVVFRSSRRNNVLVAGRSYSLFDSGQQTVAIGRGLLPLDIERRSRVAVLGSSLSTVLFGNRSPEGDEIIIAGQRFVVVGVLQPTGGFGIGSLNNSVVVPYNVAERVVPNTRVSSLDVFFAETAEVDQVQADTEAALLRIFDGRDTAFSISNQQDILDVVQSITTTLTAMLAGIAAISLLVGGIGIMNMMLVSVTERTNEIGLRKALGAEPMQIMAQFLIESVILCLIGGCAGILLGGFLAYLGAAFIGFPFVVTAGPILMSVGFSVTVGLVFGLAPARKASRLNPIDALKFV